MGYNNKLFASKLRARIAELGLSRADVAKLSGVSEDSIGKYCRGTNSPNATSVWALANALHTDPNTLLGWGMGKQ